MKKLVLNQKQELFCKYYANNSESFGNATLAYKLAYQKTSDGEKSENYYAMAGSRLMRNDKVLARINTLFLEQFNQDAISDIRLMEIIIKGKDSDAINAIKHRNDLKQRISKKVELTNISTPFAHLSDSELMAMVGV